MPDRIPFDLLAVSITAVVTPTIVLLGLEGGLIKIVVGAVFILLAPGYALVSLLIPSTHLTSWTGDNKGGTTEVTFFERTLLGVGLSVAIVPAIGVFLNYSPLGLGPGPYLTVVSSATLLLSVGAMIRRLQVDLDRRFTVGSTGFSARLWNLLGGAGTDREVYLNVIFVLGIALAVVGVGTAVAMSGSGEQFTEFYVEAQDPDTRESVADEYPTEMIPGKEYEVFAGITNREHQTMEYTVVVELQRLEDGEVVERSKLRRFQRTLNHNETVQEPISVEPNIVGKGLRLSYQLYLGTPPDETSVNAAYRHAYIWVDVPAS